jgi:hypothetical protein
MKKILIITLAVIALLAAGCNKANNSNNSNDSEYGTSTEASMQKSEAELALRQDMRKLWTDHVLWTREYIVAAALNAPHAQTAAARLLKNQEDIGNAVAKYYGTDAGNKLTALLKEHINLAVAVTADAKAGDTAKFNADNDKWKQNGNDIADFLASANSNWPQATLRNMMAKHLSLLTSQVTDNLNKKYDASIADFDAGLDHILMMADALSDGIIKQFPDKFE